MAGYVDAPYVAIWIDANAVRAFEHAVAPALQKVAVLVELNDRVRPAIEYPDVVITVHRDAGGLAERPSFWQLPPARNHFKRQRRAGFQLAVKRRNAGDDRGCDDQEFHVPESITGLWRKSKLLKQRSIVVFVPSTVIIVGAGVTGLSTAYRLLRRRFGRVIVLDKGTAGEGSSRRAAGIITGLLWSETGIRLRKRCLELFREFSEDLPGYRFRDVGCLNLFTAESWLERAPMLGVYDRAGAAYEVLTAIEVQARWPVFRLPESTLGLWDPAGGYSEPSEYIPALRRRVVDLGGEIRENTAA